MARGVRFELEVAPGVLDGMPPLFVQRIREACLAVGLVAFWWDAMSCTAHVAHGWKDGFAIDILREPGSTRLRIFVDPWSRLQAKFVPINFAIFVVVLAIDVLTFAGPRFAWHLAFFLAAVTMFPLFTIEWYVVRALNRTPQLTLERAADAVRVQLTR